MALKMPSNTYTKKDKKYFTRTEPHAVNDVHPLFSYFSLEVFHTVLILWRNTIPLHEHPVNSSTLQIFYMLKLFNSTSSCGYTILNIYKMNNGIFTPVLLLQFFYSSTKATPFPNFQLHNCNNIHNVCHYLQESFQWNMAYCPRRWPFVDVVICLFVGH